jgi:hypothetical protein
MHEMELIPSLSLEMMVALYIARNCHITFLT